MINSSGFVGLDVPRRLSVTRLFDAVYTAKAGVTGRPSRVVAGFRFLPLPEALTFIIGASSYAPESSAALTFKAPLNCTSTTCSLFAFFPLPTWIVSTWADSTVTSAGGVVVGVGVGV